MGNVTGEPHLALQQPFPYKSYSFKNSDCHKFSFFNDEGLKLGHFDIFQHAPSISGIRKVIAHNFMKSRSCDGLAAKSLLCSLPFHSCKFHSRL